VTRKKNSTLCPDTSTTAGPGLAPDDPHRETPQLGVGVLRAPRSDSRPASATWRTSGPGGGSRRRRHVQPQHLVYSGPANWSPPPATPGSSPPRAPGAGLSGSTLTSCRLSGREALRADAGRRSRAGSVRCRRARWLAAPGEGGRPRKRLARQTCQQECSLRCVNAASGRADRCLCCESLQSQGGSTSHRCRCGPLRLTYRSGFPAGIPVRSGARGARLGSGREKPRAESRLADGLPAGVSRLAGRVLPMRMVQYFDEQD
jgi:hypothetical protein